MIYFVPGMEIEEGMRYTDGIRRYVAIRSGQALSLTDEEFLRRCKRERRTRCSSISACWWQTSATSAGG